MSPTPPSSLNPSQAVERIREIIVGRQLEKLEARVVRLESAGSCGQVPSQWEERLCTAEARLEALQQSLQRLDESNREQSETRSLRQQEEIQRLAAQIQQVAAIKSAANVQPAIDQLEHKLGAWLNHWQGSLQAHLNEREERLARQMREEVATLWESTESQITRLQSRSLDRDMIEERFSRIAAAARALAECAAPLSSGTEYHKP
jgi:DNA repair exonuclease SbcCD ATPase subunit